MVKSSEKTKAEIIYLKKKGSSSSESPLKPTQICKKRQCLTVCAVNGLKKEQLALTDGAENQL